jgi:MFS family permease
MQPPASRTPGFAQGIILLLPITMAVMGIVLLVPVLPEILREFEHVPGAPYLVQLGILTMPAAGVLVFSPLAGTLADRYGRRRILLVAMVAYAGLGIAPMLLSNIWAVIASRVGVGICEAAIMTASTTLISDYFTGRTRERWLASQTAVASLSALVLLQLAGVLGSAYGWRGPFAVYLISLVIAVGVAILTWEPARQTLLDTRSTASRAAMPWRRVAGICAITILAAIMFYTFQTQAGLALDVLGVHDASARGTSTMIASLGVPLGTFVFWRASRLHIALLLSLEFLVMAFGFIWMGHATDAHAFTLAAFVNQLGCGLILPTLLTWATHGLSFEVRGRCTGWWTGSFASGQFLSGGVATFLAARLGGLLPALSFLGVVCFGGVICSLTVFIVRRRVSGARVLRAA